MSGRPDPATPPRLRLGLALLVALLHLLAIAGLIRAFAPDLTGRAVDAVVATFAVPLPPPPAPTPPPPPPPRATAAAGAGGAAGRRAEPRPRATPPPRLALAPPLALPTGPTPTGGAREQGDGPGAGGAGSGPGEGTAGSGTGGASPPLKIAGEISSARDFPAATRDLRIGGRVVIALTVSAEGRPESCRVLRPSRDPAADAITCRLALERFRFRPATDGAGRPVAGIYGWQQRWFAPGQP